MYLELRQILDIVFSSVLSLENFVELKTYVRDHVKLYTENFDDNLKLKHHIMVHPQLLKMLGSSTDSQCIRLEAKHRDSTTVANSSQSRKNASITLVTRHQLVVCGNILERLQTLFLNTLETGKLNSVVLIGNDQHSEFIEDAPSSFQNPRSLVYTNIVEYSNITSCKQY